MNTALLAPPRPPELELRHQRHTELGYEPTEDGGLLRCLDHGYPTPLARWHCHEEYELHLLVRTRGEVYVGDYVGSFEPGHLVLVGPRLPHNWVSTDVPPGGVALRDRVILFAHAPLIEATRQFGELAEFLPLLERARRGLQFFGMEAQALPAFERIRASRGLSRLGLFCDFMAALARCADYRLLASAPPAAAGAAPDTQRRIDEVVEHVIACCAEPLSMAEVGRRFGMTESAFSRFFRRATGSTFTDFVIGLRVHKACELLARTDRHISRIGTEVGFHNLANFNRRFLKLKGVTPSEFRRRAASMVR